MSNDAAEIDCPDRDDYVKELRGDSKNKRYKAGCLGEYLRFLKGRDPRVATRRDLEKYALSVASQPISSSTKTTKLRLVLAWHHWMTQTGRVEQDPGQGVTPAELLAGASGEA